MHFQHIAIGQSGKILLFSFYRSFQLYQRVCIATEQTEQLEDEERMAMMEALGYQDIIKYNKCAIYVYRDSKKTPLFIAYAIYAYLFHLGSRSKRRKKR